MIWIAPIWQRNDCTISSSIYFWCFTSRVCGRFNIKVNFKKSRLLLRNEEILGDLRKAAYLSAREEARYFPTPKKISCEPSSWHTGALFYWKTSKRSWKFWQLFITTNNYAPRFLRTMDLRESFQLFIITYTYEVLYVSHDQSQQIVVQSMSPIWLMFSH